MHPQTQTTVMFVLHYEQTNLWQWPTILINGKFDVAGSGSTVRCGGHASSTIIRPYSGMIMTKTTLICHHRQHTSITSPACCPAMPRPQCQCSHAHAWVTMMCHPGSCQCCFTVSARCMGPDGCNFMISSWHLHVGLEEARHKGSHS